MSRPNFDDVDYYDCSGKPDGNYLHPSDCTRYITCHNGNAADMACPDCPPGEPLCKGDQYLVYDRTREQCGWPSELPCLTD